LDYVSVSALQSDKIIIIRFFIILDVVQKVINLDFVSKESSQTWKTFHKLGSFWGFVSDEL